jgi:Family of unknown function (DUF6152)
MMMTSQLAKAAALAACLTIGLIELASAHHSFAMFDRTQEVAVSGTVVRWAFNSPHVAIYIKNDSDGEVWAFEGAAPAALIPRNMTGYTFQPGDHIMVVMCPLRDGRQGGAIGYIVKDGDEDDFDAWFRPNDGGCGPSKDWGDWYQAGYRSKADAEAALGPDRDGSDD